MKIEMELQPFSVPNFAIVKLPPKQRQEGFVESPKFALEELDVVTLSKMCDEFRATVFKKAKKTDRSA